METIIKPAKLKKSKFRPDWVGIAALAIAIIFGIWGIYLATVQTALSKAQIALSQKQDSTSLDLKHFAELLEKTDSVITLSKDQLVLNREVQERTNAIYRRSTLGNMNKLLDKIYKISEEHFLLCLIHPPFSEKVVIDYSRRLDRLDSLFVSEMENPYLNSNDTLYEYWSLAYSSIGELNGQLKSNIERKGIKLLNLNTGKTEIGKIDTAHAELMIRNIDIFKSVGGLPGFFDMKIKRDKIRMGVLNKNGKHKVNADNFYKRVTFK